MPSEFQDDLLLPLFRSIVSGALDPDKLDYLCRDAFFCGVPYGTQDVDFAIRSLSIDNTLQLRMQSLMPLEHILFSKYLMYKSVYWHEKVRSATAMIKHALFHALAKKIIFPHQLLFLTDTDFRALCKEKQLACKKLSLVEAVTRGTIHTCVSEYPFENIADIACALEDVKTRSIAEQRISDALRIPDVIIDLPEPIQFENPYESVLHTDTVFTHHTAQHIARTLRKLRIFLPAHKNTDALLKNTSSHSQLMSLMREALHA